MKRTAAILGVAAAAIWSAGVFAQGRNFAGSWTIDGERTTAANASSLTERRVSADGSTGAVARSGGGGGGGRGGAVAGGAVAAGGATEMRVAAGGGGAVAMTGGGGGGRGGGGMAGPTVIAIDGSNFTVGPTAYHLDGSVTTIGDRTAKAAWHGDKLVIETTSQGPNGAVVTTASWYLDGDALVRESSTPAPGGGDPIVRKTYYKKS